jgi:hypothetical protein
MYGGLWLPLFITKTFKMSSGNVENARLELNLGKNAGAIYFSDVNLTCLDCGSSAQIGTGQQSSVDATREIDWRSILMKYINKLL